MPTMSEPHQHREMAESFGADAERYDRARPSYPEAIVARIVAASPGTDVLDVGCGTGISSRQFRAAGCRVLGIEVDPRMAELTRKTGIEVEIAKFEDWNAGGRKFDTVTAGQAWHWVDPVAGAAKAAEVLRPGGRLAPFWNVLRSGPEVADAFAETYRRILPPAMAEMINKPPEQMYEVIFDKVSAGIRQAGGFGEPELWREQWQRTFTTREWLDVLPTFGTFPQLQPDQQRRLLAGHGAAIDEAGGSFTAHYTTVAVTAVL